jgi:hypothetical protein
VALGAALLGDVGTFEHANAGVSAFVAWTPWRFRVEASATYWFTQRVDLPLNPPNPPRGGRLHLAEVGLRACYALWPRTASRTASRTIELSPCAGAMLDDFRGEAYGVSEPGAGTAAFWALRGGALVSWRVVGPLALRLELEALLPVTARPTFEISGVGPLHRPASLSGRAGAGVEVRF